MGGPTAVQPAELLWRHPNADDAPTVLLCQSDTGHSKVSGANWWNELLPYVIFDHSHLVVHLTFDKGRYSGPSNIL